MIDRRVRTDNEIMSRAEVEERLKGGAAPVDIDQLIAKGILEKKGHWYVIHQWNELPEHAKSGIIEVKTIGERTLVKFRAKKRKVPANKSSFWQAARDNQP